MNFTLIGFLCYLVMVLLVGFWAYKQNKNHLDYYIAGRKLNSWVVALSERASGESAWLLLSLPGAAYATGLIEMWAAIGCVLGIIMYWLVGAERIRVQSASLNAITVPDFFAQKYQTYQKTIRIIALLIIIFFFIFYLAAQFNGAGKVLQITFGIPPFWGMVIGAVVIIFYTMMGGFYAVAYTDFVQALIMIGTLVVLPIVGLFVLAKHNIDLVEVIKSASPTYGSLTGGATGWAGFAVILSGLSWGFGYFGQPHLLTRFMAIDHPESISKSRRIAYMWAIPAFAGAFAIGLVGKGLMDGSEVADAEHIMPILANDLLPSWLAGIFISGAIAAMMSTADSQLLVISSSVIEDFYHQTLGTHISEKKLLRYSRGITLLIGLIAFGIAVNSEELIFSMVSYAWAGLGASFGPALILTLWWKRTHGMGIIAGMLTGLVVTVVWTRIDVLNDFVHARFSAFALSFLVIVIVSKLHKK